MNRMEIIEIRVQLKVKQKLEKELKMILTEIEKEPGEKTMRIYKRIHLETDYVILLLNESNDLSVKDGQLGIRLNSILKDYGMVNYSKWHEI